MDIESTLGQAPVSLEFTGNDAGSTATLDMVAPGTTVRVTELSDCNPELFRRLLVMGVFSGSSVTVVGRAPLGDPISISTLGYVLSLRLAEARHVSVSTFE